MNKIVKIIVIDNKKDWEDSLETAFSFEFLDDHPNPGKMLMDEIDRMRDSLEDPLPSGNLTLEEYKEKYRDHYKIKQQLKRRK